jgi:hypothetical protein
MKYKKPKGAYQKANIKGVFDNARRKGYNTQSFSYSYSVGLLDVFIRQYPTREKLKIENISGFFDIRSNHKRGTL